MSASTNDKFKRSGASTVTTLAAPGKALAATSINVGSTTNYDTTTGIVIAIRVVDSSGNLVAGTYTEWSATVSSATALAIVGTPVYGNDQVYAAGSTTQVFIPVSAYSQNTLIDGILVSHNQDGTIKDNIITTAMLSAKHKAGWDVLATAMTRTGNNSGTISGDVTSLLAIGLPLELTDTTTKWYYVTSFSYSAGTGLTTVGFTGGTDYILVGNATNIYFGNRPSPVGFPQYFAWTPTWTGSGSLTYSSVTYNRQHFSMIGKQVFVNLDATGTVANSADYIYMTLPIANVNGYYLNLLSPCADAATYQNSWIRHSAETTKISFQKANAVAWINGTVTLYANFSYQI